MTNANPLVSVISPTYNHARYIAQCIRSVLAQSYSGWELLIMDDESTDPTPEIVRSFADERIQYHRQSHRGIHGLADTYNDALGLAHGELIAILEGDDFWPPDKLQELVRKFERPEVMLAYGLARKVRSDGTPTEETVPSRKALRTMSPQELCNDPIGSAIRPMLVPDPGLFTYPCTLLIRRDALQSMGGFHSVADGHAVDWATCLQLALKGQFAFVPDVMGFWRRHAVSVNSSSRLEEHIREDYRHVQSFALAHQKELHLTQADLDAMERAWDCLWGPLRRMQGRRLLLNRNWDAARGRFRHALASPDTPKGKVASVVGIAASFAHRDIEWIWRWQDKPTLLDES